MYLAVTRRCKCENHKKATAQRPLNSKGAIIKPRLNFMPHKCHKEKFKYPIPYEYNATAKDLALCPVVVHTPKECPTNTTALN